MAHTLHRIRFTADTANGREGYMETDDAGRRVALYDDEGDQFDAPECEYEVTREVCDIDPEDVDAFNEAIADDKTAHDPGVKAPSAWAKPPEAMLRWTTLGALIDLPEISQNEMATPRARWFASKNRIVHGTEIFVGDVLEIREDGAFYRNGFAVEADARPAPAAADPTANLERLAGAIVKTARKLGIVVDDLGPHALLKAIVDLAERVNWPGDLRQDKPCGCKLRPWPVGNGLILAESAIAPILIAINGPRASVARRYVEAGGYDLGKADLATGASPDIELSRDPGENRSPMWRAILARALYVAFLLGVEQGRRLERSGK